NGTSQSKQNSQSSSTTFIYKTLIIPSFLDSCFISSTASEDKRVMVRLDFKICASDKNFSSIWTYTTMMLSRVHNHHGGKCVHPGLKSAQDKDVGLGEADSETWPKRSLKKAFQDISKLEYKFQDQENSEDIFSFGSALEDFICVVFVLDMNIKSLKKYGMESCDPVGTLMEIKDKLDLDQNGSPVDVTKYRSLIGALMYLTSSRPDIVHATCLCTWYQAKPTEKHLKEVKRIFRYLRGTILNCFELTGFSDADYAGCKDTFKSTFGGAQFLGEKLVSWSSKKQELYVACQIAEASRIGVFIPLVVPKSCGCDTVIRIMAI
ncbi:uncharacterized mitochondrial protein-like protein, partial [Tanacetum coccineum]